MPQKGGQADGKKCMVTMNLHLVIYLSALNFSAIATIKMDEL